MLTFLAVLAVAAVLLAAAAVATYEGNVLVDSPPDDADVVLPDGPLQPEDVNQIRFGMVLRGYRMSEVDRVLSRFAEDLATRDARIAELERAALTPAPAAAPAAAPPTAPVAAPAPAPEPLEPPEPVLPPEPATPVVPPEPPKPVLPPEPPEPEPKPALDAGPEPAREARPEPWLADLPTGPPPEPLQAPLPAAPSVASYDDTYDLFPELQLPEPAPSGVQDATDEGTDRADDADSWSVRDDSAGGRGTGA